MAQNVLPKTPGALAVLAGKCEIGLAKYEGPLNITQITAVGLDSDIGGLTGAITAFNAARAARTAAHLPLKNASTAARDFLQDARLLLAVQWGETWSTQWAAAGWTDNTTAVPASQEGRLELLQELVGFLGGNPAYEVVQVPPQKPITFTAARAGIVAGALSTALAGVAAADKDSDDRLADRAAADLVVRKDLRMLIGILNQKLTPNDSRWEEFGLNAPGKAGTPKAPTHLQSHAALPGQVHLTCDVPEGADHLRWFEKTAGAADYVFVEDTADGELLVTGRPTGTSEWRATAVNPAGESVPSASISVTVA